MYSYKISEQKLGLGIQMTEINIDTSIPTTLAKQVPDCSYCITFMLTQGPFSHLFIQLLETAHKKKIY